MFRAELEHIIRAASEHAGQDQLLIVGSQSILGTYSEYELPEASTMSEEADVIPLFDDAEGTRSTQIDGGMGEMTPFHRTFGIYAQGVDRRTSLLPPGWADRLVPIRNENTNYKTGWCLDVHDLCSAKLIANRDKDRVFVQSLIDDDLVLVSTIRERVEATDVPADRKAIALQWLRHQKLDQPDYRAPELPEVPDTWPNHPATVIAEQDAAAPAPANPWDGSWPHAQGGQGHMGPGHGGPSYGM